MTDEKSAPSKLNPVEIYVKMNAYLLKEFPGITVGDMECLIALMIMDADAVARDVAPEMSDLSIEETVSRFLFTMGGANNTLVRVADILSAFYAGIRKEKEKEAQKNE